MHAWTDFHTSVRLVVETPTVQLCNCSGQAGRADYLEPKLTAAARSSLEADCGPAESYGASRQQTGKLKLPQGNYTDLQAVPSAQMSLQSVVFFC